MTAYSLGRLSLIAALLHAGMGHAQGVTTNITSSGLGTQISAPQSPNAFGGSTYDITGGTRAGPTLFHSLGSFNVGATDMANFKNDTGAPTSNILGRVTGGVSNIDGWISTTGFPNANLYLINPAGWIFGANAGLQVEGSFHVSTANYLLLEDIDPNKTRFKFSADNSPLPPLLQAPAPIAFGFLGPTGSITINGDPTIPTALSVLSGQTLSFVGGDVQVNGQALVAPSGRIQIGSFASAGEATVDGLNGAFSSLGHIQIISGSAIIAADFDGFNGGGTVLLRGGQIDINNLSAIDTSGNPAGTAGGTIIIRGGQLIVDNSLIASQTFSDTNTSGGAIDLSLDQRIEVNHAPGPDLGVFTRASAGGFGAGRGGDIHVAAPQISINGGNVSSTTLGDGRAGDVLVQADSLAVIAGGSLGSFTQGTGPGGDVNVSAKQSVSISGRNPNPSSIFTQTVSSGNAGRLMLSTPLLMMFDGGSIVTASLFGGAGGDVVLTVGQLNMNSGATINSLNTSDAPSGNISISATGPVALSDNLTGIFSSTNSTSSRPAGDISVHGKTITVTNGALIQSGSAQEPQGGSVTLTGDDSIAISARGGVSTQAQDLPVGPISISTPMLVLDDGYVSASTLGSGHGGSITAQVGTLTLSGGGQMVSSSERAATGAAGDVSVAANAVSISGSSPDGKPVAPFNTSSSSGIFSAAHSTASNGGDAGRITLSGGGVTVGDGGSISVSTTGAGNAGTITANVANMTVSGGHLDSSTSAGGAGGAINVTAGGQASVVNGGRVTADSTGSGTTGNITIVAGDRITMNGGSISTRAVTSDGGDITLKAPNIVRLEGAQITTSVQSGVGKGGNVLIDPTFLVMNNSSITANAFGGPGGNITIIADNFLASSTALLQASSALSTPGTIEIKSPENNIAGSIAQLSRAFVDASRLLRGMCSARREGAPSSFVLAGRGGVPAEADGYLPSTIVAAPPSALALAYLDDCAR